MRTNLAIRRTLGVTLTVLTAVAVTGCGGDTGHDTAAPAGGGHNSTTSAPATSSSSAATGTSAHNKADVTFAQSMILHHKQAIEMADMGEKASNTDVKTLAEKIKSVQQPEIEKMSTWLSAWGEPMPSEAAGGHGMPGMSDSEMPGMMTDKDMASLKNAKGAAFDTMFLEMMIEHHQGAVAMANTQQQQGQNADAKALAETIKTDQSAEIKQMESLLDKL
jgi:uncharacterized protein (DUF305 family)